jgi:hypothetical protein
MKIYNAICLDEYEKAELLLEEYIQECRKCQFLFNLRFAYIYMNTGRPDEGKKSCLHA